MKVIICRRLLIGRHFYAINICGIVFARGKLDTVIAHHEYIHTLQQREMLFIFFYLWYLFEWLFRFAVCRNWMQAYRNISFEREAYANDNIHDYHHLRQHFAWVHYL